MASDIVPEPPAEQKCGGCSLVKAAAEFTRNKARKSGLSALCRDCERAKNQASYAKHAEKRRAYAKEYAGDHKEERSIANQAYREQHRDELNASTREWRKTHKVVRSEASQTRNRDHARQRYAEDQEYAEARRAYARQYRENNPEKVKSAYKAWLDKNRDKAREYARQYYRTWKTGDELKEYQRQIRARHAIKRAVKDAAARSKRGSVPGEFTNEHIYWLHKWQDNRCFYCNETLVEKNHARPIEHIVPIFRGGSNHPYNIARCCGPCNYGKQSKLFSAEWQPEAVLPATQFHSTYCTAELHKELTARGIPHEIRPTHIVIGDRPMFILSTFWMSSRSTPIETLETVRAKHPNSVLFFDHEWRARKDALTNVLLAKAGLAERIGAREMEVGIPSFDEAKEFMNRWHIQGFVGGTWIVGLKHADRWRAMAVFRDTQRGYELSRMAFCAHVPGGLSRILTAFRRQVSEQKPIVTFADLRFGDGNGYLATGFQSSGDSLLVTAYTNAVGLYHWYIAKRKNLPKVLDFYDEKLSEIENLRVNGIFRLTLLPRKKFVLAA